jgi:hypothetical protein
VTKRGFEELSFIISNEPNVIKQQNLIGVKEKHSLFLSHKIRQLSEGNYKERKLDKSTFLENHRDGPIRKNTKRAALSSC